MAALFSVNVYQKDQGDPIPLGNVNKQAFPYAGVSITSCNQLLSTGVTVYSAIRLLSSTANALYPALYYVIETQASLVASS
jgi:hypothetical protein